MSASLFPDEYIPSVYKVDFKALYKKGFDTILFDVDNTLVAHNAPADSRAISFFKDLHEIGFKTYMVSNNYEPRVADFCAAVGGNGYRFLSNKPSPKAYLSCVKEAKSRPENTLFFGDQIFTDTLGAKRAGVTAIMVKPVKKWYEEPQIIAKRFLEAIILFFYKIKVGIAGSRVNLPMLP